MDIDSYLFPNQILKDISNHLQHFGYCTKYAAKNINENIWYIIFKQCWLSVVIYRQSIVNLEDLSKMLALISYKTSNNQEILERMPFWRFNNLSIALNEIIEEENKGNNGEGHDNSNFQKTFASQQKSFGSMMSQAKSGFKSFKP